MARNTSAAIKAAKQCAYMNGQYHADRESFLDRLHRFLMFMVIMLGAAALTDLLPEAAIKWCALGTAAAGAIDLLLDLSVRARTAAYLRENYFEIAANLEEGTSAPSQAHAGMLRLAAKEEPPYKAAHAIAENWATWAVYGTDKSLPCKIGWFRTFTRNVFRYGGRDFSVGAA